MPSNTLALVEAFWIDQHFHAVVEKWVWLSMIENVKFNTASFKDIRCPEEEPYNDVKGFNYIKYDLWC